MQSILFHFIYCSYSRRLIRIFDAQLGHITYQVLLHVGDQAFLLLRLVYLPEPNLLYYILMFRFGAPASSRPRSKIAAIFTTRYVFSGTASSFNRVNHIKSYNSELEVVSCLSFVGRIFSLFDLNFNSIPALCAKTRSSVTEVFSLPCVIKTVALMVFNRFQPACDRSPSCNHHI